MGIPGVVGAMLRRLKTCVLILGLVLPAWANDHSATISGYVRSAAGAPQMGAVVQILGSARHSLTVFTDSDGFYSVVNLLPGVYTLKVSAPLFMPAQRDRVGVRPGTSVNVNVTLNTLFDVMNLGPMRSVSDDDDWKWTLRSVANRPILRVFDDPSSSVEHQSRKITGTLSFLAGSSTGGYGSASDVTTGFTLDREVLSASHVGLSGNVNYGAGLPAGVLRATYSHQMLTGSAPTMSVTMHRYAATDPFLHNAALQSLDLSAGDDLAIGDVLELKFGSELQTIQFLGTVTAINPNGTADLHLSRNTVLEYQYSSTLPGELSDKGLPPSQGDLSDSSPRVSMQNFSPKLERAHHQEVSLSHRMGKTNLQLAAFSDRVGDTDLIGAGELTSESGNVLPDLYSGTFSFTGNNLNTNGVRAVLQQKLSNHLTATFDYSFGGALNLSRDNVALSNAQQWIETVRRHALAAKLSGRVYRTHTRWIASYRWVNANSLTPVDMFNCSPGQADPYLSLFIRQRLPGIGSLSGHMEAIIDVRNLLAQGYVPVMGQDGQTVYLVQTVRSVRGGVAFSF